MPRPPLRARPGAATMVVLVLALLTAAAADSSSSPPPPGGPAAEYAAAVRQYFEVLRAVAKVVPSPEQDALLSGLPVLDEGQVNALLAAAPVGRVSPPLKGLAPVPHVVRRVHGAKTAAGGGEHVLDVTLEAAGGAPSGLDRYARVQLLVRGTNATRAAPTVSLVGSVRRRGSPPPARLAEDTPADEDDWRLILRAEQANCSAWSVWDHCAPGSLVENAWLNRTLASQRRLEDGLDMADATWLGTHNSYNARGDGYGCGDNVLNVLVRALTGNATNLVLANQEFSLLDQLRMGVRLIELDPHWFAGEMRICHAGGFHATLMDDLVRLVEELLGHSISWDTRQLGCAPWDRPFELGVAEVAEWLGRPENADEVIVLYLDDDTELQEWYKLNELVAPLVRHFNGTLLPRAELQRRFGGVWPSRDALLSAGRRVVVANNLDYGWPYDTAMFGHFWTTQEGVANLTYPDCRGTYADEGIWRFFGDATVYGPLSDGPAKGLLNETTLPLVYRCGAALPCTDTVSPYLLGYAAWSWAPGQPEAGAGDAGCVAVGRASPPTQARVATGVVTAAAGARPPPPPAHGEGRWYALPRSSPLPVACRSLLSRTLWTVTQRAATFDEAARTDLCPEGFEFAAPANAAESWLVAVAAGRAGAAQVWTNREVAHASGRPQASPARRPPP